MFCQRPLSEVARGKSLGNPVNIFEPLSFCPVGWSGTGFFKFFKVPCPVTPAMAAVYYSSHVKELMATIVAPSSELYNGVVGWGTMEIRTEEGGLGVGVRLYRGGLGELALLSDWFFFSHDCW